MTVQPNSPSGPLNPRPISPIQGPGPTSRPGGEEGRTEANETDRSGTAQDRQDQIRAQQRLRAARLGQQNAGQRGATPQDAGQTAERTAGRESTEGTQAADPSPTRPERARLQTARLSRARLANAQETQPRPPVAPAGDQVEISGGALTVEQARNRIARLQNFISEQLGQQPAATNDSAPSSPTPPAEPQVEPPVEPPAEAPAPGGDTNIDPFTGQPVPEGGFSIEQTLQRIARLLNYLADGGTIGSPLVPPTPTPEPAPELTPAADLFERAEVRLSTAPISLTPQVETPAQAPPVEDTQFPRADVSSQVSTDSLALSAGAAALLNATEQLQFRTQPESSSPLQRVLELRNEFESGTLNTAERIQRAADTLILSESDRIRV